MVGNATWTGVRLCDVLKESKIQFEEAKFIEFIGADVARETGKPYGISLPLKMCLDE
jgi:DMSO/TMAO reductase YedYZ molybdopterin-dependent catalytic subunit